MRTDVSGWDWKDLVEYLQRNYGIGYDDGSMPYYRWRAREAIIVGNMCKSRRVDIATVVVCAEFCRAHNKSAETVGGLLSHLREAAVWDRARASTHLERDIHEAVSRERQLSDDESEDWVGRLLRAAPEKQREVLAEWQNARR